MPSDPPHLQGVALVTGAASGIGRAAALTFVKEGCTKLVLADLNDDGLKSVAEEAKKLHPAVRTVTVKVDVSSEADVERLIQTAVKEFGAIHYAVNNAGVTSNPRVRTHELPTSAWDRVVSINLRGLLTRGDAIAYAADGIRVNAVLPGFIRTPLVEESIRRGANYEELVKTIPTKRWATPEELAETIVFLSSEKASLVNGLELVADGGFSKL